MFDMTRLCLGEVPHTPHNIDVTLIHHCSGPQECGMRNPLMHRPHSITKMILVPCDGVPKE